MSVLPNKHQLHNYMLAVLACDSAGLASHWEYNRQNIVSQYKTIDRLYPPLSKFHQGKQKGEQTHMVCNIHVISKYL
jgi:hypothetical protein